MPKPLKVLQIGDALHHLQSIGNINTLHVTVTLAPRTMPHWQVEQHAEMEQEARCYGDTLAVITGEVTCDRPEVFIHWLHARFGPALMCSTVTDSGDPADAPFSHRWERHWTELVPA